MAVTNDKSEKLSCILSNFKHEFGKLEEAFAKTADDIDKFKQCKALLQQLDSISISIMNEDNNETPNFNETKTAMLEATMIQLKMCQNHQNLTKI